MIRRLRIWVLALLTVLAAGCASEPSLTVSAPPENDLVRVLRASGAAFIRVDTPAEAVAAAPEGGGVLLLAGGYPDTLTAVDSMLYAEAERKRLRLVVEFPALLPGGPPDSVFAARWERGVTTGDAFAPALGRHRIVTIHDARVAAFPADTTADTAWLALARVAGLDSAVYGLAGTPAHPALFEVSGRDLLVATTQLSRFVTARYAPPEAWTAVWTRILAWAAPGAEPPELVWEPAVRPTFGPDDVLPPDAAARAVRRGADWFHRARMLVDSAWADRLEAAVAFDDRVGPGPELDWPVGDGTLGVLEGFSSNIRWDGSQWVRWWLRADCASETAMALALRARLEGDGRDTAVAANLQDWVYRTLQRDTTGRDPDDPEYGLVAWNTVYDRVYYGDDNARVMLGTLAAAAALGADRWDRAVARAALANRRTTGVHGFRSGRLEGPELQEQGWRHFGAREIEHIAPHYESWLWAVYLRLYDLTGFEGFLETARAGIGRTMAAYPDAWRWTNGLQQERARMLLPLAWLVRVDDTPEHRAWLDRVAADLLAHQDASGAIHEALGTSGFGRYGPPATNAAYGTSEAPLIQATGDPVADLLYTSAFAFLSLTEAAAATGDPDLAAAAGRLETFLVRVQIAAPTHPELDGAWFRAFDTERWTYWASNADHGWGAWAIETGWTQSWITTVLALRAMETNFWDWTAGSRIDAVFDDVRAAMAPEE